MVLKQIHWDRPGNGTTAGLHLQVAGRKKSCVQVETQVYLLVGLRRCGPAPKVRPAYVVRNEKRMVLLREVFRESY